MRARFALVVLLLAAARAQAQPAPLPVLDVPFVSQSEALCGGAAAAMVLRYWGERGVSAETFAPLVDRSSAGIKTTALAAALRERGWNVTALSGSDEFVASELASGRPVIALIEDRPHTFHYIVIVAANDRSVVFHDPARAPLRVFARDEFERRSRAAGRWMAIVLPPSPDAAPRPESSFPPPAPFTACDERVARGVSQAQSGDLSAAERTLTEALSCPGPAASRELAGVRLLQRRWEDVAELSAQAVAVDQSDAYSWKLLGTSRFLLNQPLAALDAWNHAGEPRLDLIRVDGLERTRQRPVERMLGLTPDKMISTDAFRLAEQALRDVPSLRSTRLELVPVAQGLAELHATVEERGAFPRDVWTWTAIGGRAAVTRTLSVNLGSFSGAGESVGLEWRFWPNRPRVGVSLRAPAAWPGVWGADVAAESQAFDQEQPDLTRRGGRLMVSRRLAPFMRVDLRGGAERWNITGTLATLGATTRFLTRTEHFAMRADADGWLGSSRFGAYSVDASLSSATRSVSSGTTPLGAVVTASSGAALVLRTAPLDLWPAGDVGQARSTLARAHPLLEHGIMQVERLGRAVANASGEAQYWWKGPALSRIGAAGFVDVVRTMQRAADADPINDVDIGVGGGFASLLIPGRFRVDYAHGLRDGADVLTVRYLAPGW